MATLACLVAGSAAASAVWQLYLTRFLPITDQFAVGTLQEWRFDLLPALLNASWTVVQQHQIFYLLVLLAVALGCYALVAKRRRPLTTLDTMMAICGIAFIGHIATLIMAYLGTGFEEWGIRIASSWQRYASQVGFSCCAAVLLLVLLRLSAIRLPVALSGTRSYLLITTVAVLAYLPVAASAVGTLRYFDRYRDESRRLALAALNGDSRPKPAGRDGRTLVDEFPALFGVGGNSCRASAPAAGFSSRSSLRRSSRGS